MSNILKTVGQIKVSSELRRFKITNLHISLNHIKYQSNGEEHEEEEEDQIGSEERRASTSRANRFLRRQNQSDPLLLLRSDPQSDQQLLRSPNHLQLGILHLVQRPNRRKTSLHQEMVQPKPLKLHRSLPRHLRILPDEQSQERTQASRLLLGVRSPVSRLRVHGTRSSQQRRRPPLEALAVECEGEDREGDR